MHLKLSLFAAVLCVGVALGTDLQKLCSKEGVYENPDDPSHHTFIRCELEPVELECPDDFFFSAEKGRCVEKNLPIDHSTIDWSQLLKCPEGVDDQYFRNPYDCSRFYRCYKQGTIERMDSMHCLPTMQFDETVSTCLPIPTFRELNGECQEKQLPKEIIDKEREEREKEKKEREELERQEKLREEQKRLEQERLEREREERERELKEREQKERDEIERLEKERLELERLEKEHLEKEREELERLEKLHKELERIEREKEEKIREEKERERKELEELERLRKEKEKLEKEKKDREDEERRKEESRLAEILRRLHDLFGH